VEPSRIKRRQSLQLAMDWLREAEANFEPTRYHNGLKSSVSRFHLSPSDSAARHKISNIIVAPARAVMPLGSKGGATSTTSPPMTFRA
jgi:hypothetical protein